MREVVALWTGLALRDLSPIHLIWALTVCILVAGQKMPLMIFEMNLNQHFS